MPAVMVQGCTSWAGKSLVATALCRWYADRGLRVAPYKAQNMSTNARVVDGGELGVAQWLQAHAARVVPDVRMGPVLVKPEHDGSQVVVLGRADHELSRRAWTQRPPSLAPVVDAALDQLLGEFDLVVCEGAGSPAETNLRSTDLANMRVAHRADAPVLLVVDIDRGGAFAHLVGTWSVLPPDDRARLRAFVLNRFRGDARLLGDGPAGVTRATGMAHAGVLPMLEHRLPDEDGARDLAALRPAAAADGGPPPVVAVVRYPTASNLDELVVLATASELRWARTPGDLDGADLVVLPGSKHVSADLAWMRERGLDAALRRAHDRGARVLGVCGGLQLLGERLEGGAGGLEEPGPGLGLLPLATRYREEKQVGRARVTFGDVPPPWDSLTALAVDAYDIRHGETRALRPDGVAAVLPDGRGFARGRVLGLACHGVLEDPRAVRAVLGPRAAEPAGDDLEEVLDGLAAAVEEHLDTDLLVEMTGGLL